jgi:hypothetical protein
MEDRFLKFMLILSLGVHVAIMGSLQWKRHEKSQKVSSPVMYRVLAKKDTSKVDVYARQVRDSAPPPLDPLMSDIRMGSSKSGSLAGGTNFMPREGKEMASELKVFERAPERVKGLRLSKEVTIPILKSDKINTPAYGVYNTIIRDRIRERAYANYTKFSKGDVYLTFIVKSNGTLAGLQILENRSDANEYLRAAGFKSVEESAPFPPFPKDLNYPELTFNIQISFRDIDEEEQK